MPLDTTPRMLRFVTVLKQYIQADNLCNPAARGAA